MTMTVSGAVHSTPSLFKMQPQLQGTLPGLPLILSLIRSAYGVQIMPLTMLFFKNRFSRTGSREHQIESVASLSCFLPYEVVHSQK